MEYKKLSEYKEGEEIKGYFLSKNLQVKMSRNNTAYLDLLVVDNSACIPAKMWNIPARVNLEELKASSFIYIVGKVELYNENRQINLSFIRNANEKDNFDKRLLIPTVDEDPKELYMEIKTTIDSISDNDLRNLLGTIFEEKQDLFMVSPAAITVHHSRIGGLVLHTCEMLRVAKSLCEIFPIVNRNYLLTGVILHDIGKLEEMKRNNVQMVEDYTIEGKLLGHIILGITYVHDVGNRLGIPAEKIVKLEHLILSHHGKPEYGSPKVPMSVEAAFLNYCDQISSTYNIYYELIKDLKSGELGDKNFFLGNIEPFKF